MGQPLDVVIAAMQPDTQAGRHRRDLLGIPARWTDEQAGFLQFPFLPSPTALPETITWQLPFSVFV